MAERLVIENRICPLCGGNVDLEAGICDCCGKLNYDIVSVDTTTDSSSMDLIRRAARGDYEAQYQVGQRYEVFEKFPLNYETAVFWYKRAVKGNHNQAMFCLAVAYLQGRGINQDEKQCLYWCEKAAELGNIRAMGLAANIYGNDASPNYNKQKGMDYLQKAADAGHPASMVNLGQMYMNGGGGFHVDYAKAENLFTKAAQAGLPQAAIFLRVLAEKKAGSSAAKVNQQNSYSTTASSSTTSSSGGCYVATCVYGSYDCPEVWTLRRFRDDELALTRYGRAFIKVYYAISPTLVSWFGNTEWFKKIWRGTLNRMVQNLQNRGFESTPYEDKKWSR